jgi:hypothetical protein
MSLDVYLTLPIPSAARERIYVRRNGRNEEITRAEWDEMHPSVEPVAVIEPASERTEVFSRNITHNLGPMALEADLYDALWRPEEHDYTHARDLIEPLRRGLGMLLSDPERFQQLNPKNGWGDYDGLVDFTGAYLAACSQWPDAEVRVWR